MKATNDFCPFLEHIKFLNDQMRKIAVITDDSISKHFCNVTASIIDAAMNKNPDPIIPDWEKNFKARIKNMYPKPDCMKVLELIENILDVYEVDIFSTDQKEYEYEKVVFNSIGILAQLLKRGFLSPPIVEQLIEQINEYVPVVEKN